jgi:virulence factor Mce-like protein
MSPLGRRGPRATGGQRKGVHPLVIAAISILVIVFVTYYAFAQEVPFISHPFKLHALVNNSVAVRQDSPVRIAGIDVGTVQNVTPAGRASEINFTVDDNGLPIHKDATITIRDRLFLEGGYYLQLDPGSPSAPTLSSGDTIPMSQTATPVQFYNLLSSINAPARQSIANLLNTFNDALSRVDSQGRTVADPGVNGFKQTIPQLTPTFRDTAYITRALRGTQRDDVKTLLTSASQVTTTLQHNDAQLADLVTSLNIASGALASTDGSLAQSVSGLDQTLQVAPAALTAVDVSLPPLANLSLALDPSLKKAPPLVDGLISAVSDLAAVVEPTARGHLLTALKATFAQFPNLLRQIAGLFPITKGVTDCLKNNVTPILTSVVPDGSLSSGRPAWQDFIHALVGLAGQGSNFDANGNWDRFTEGVGSNTLAGLGSLPGVGQLVGTAPSATSNFQGSRPIWNGDLTDSVYRPDVPCTTQRAPNLASATAAPDLRPAGAGPPVSQATVAKVAKQIKRALAKKASGH